jgi:hypothetical protein
MVACGGCSGVDDKWRFIELKEIVTMGKFRPHTLQASNHPLIHVTVLAIFFDEIAKELGRLRPRVFVARWAGRGRRTVNKCFDCLHTH